PHVEPALEIRVERQQRLARLLGSRVEPRGMLWRLRAQRSGHVLDQQPPAFGHAHRRLDEDAHRLRERLLQIVQERRNVLEPADRRGRLLCRRAIGRQQQMMEAAQQVREPEFRVLGLRANMLEPPQRDPDFVQQRGAVDLFLEIGRVHFFQRRGNRLQRRELRPERGMTEPSVAIVVARHAGLRRGHRIHVPVEIEERLLDVAKTHGGLLNTRWHSSSDSTRSVRFAASNSVLHARSSLGSYPCCSSQYFTFDSPETGEMSIRCSKPNSSAGTELYTRSASQLWPFFFALMIAAACTPVPVRNASVPITG